MTLSVRKPRMKAKMIRVVTRIILVLIFLVIFLNEIGGIFTSKYFPFFGFLAGDVSEASVMLY